MDTSVRGRGTQADEIPADSLIGRMTAEAQAARDAFGYGEWEMDGRKGKVQPDEWSMVERADARFGCVGDAMRFQRAQAKGRR